MTFFPRVLFVIFCGLIVSCDARSVDLGVFNIGDDILTITALSGDGSAEQEDQENHKYLGFVAPHGGEFFLEGLNVTAHKSLTLRFMHPATSKLAGQYTIYESCSSDPLIITVRWCESCPRMVSGDDCLSGVAWQTVCPHAQSALTVDTGGQPGMHVVCQSAESKDIWLIRDGRMDSKAIPIQSSFMLKTAEDLFYAVAEKLKIVSRPANFKLPALYTLHGSLIGPQTPIPERSDAFVWLYFEGGLFIWPTSAIGAQIDAGHGLTLSVLSTRPKVLQINRSGSERLLSPEACDAILETANETLAPSTLAWQDGDDREKAADQRTSSNTFLFWNANAVVEKVAPRLTALVRLKPSFAEDLQVLRYDPGQRYVSHVDFFRPENYVNQVSFHERTLKKGAGNRFATVFMYLNDCKGGETHFARASHQRALVDQWASCSHSNFSVWPAQGKAILFYDMLPNGAPDHYSLHAGCPAETTKFAANFWFWNWEAYNDPRRTEFDIDDDDWCFSDDKDDDEASSCKVKM